MTIVTRFPPSPTGYLHIGGARTALFNWLYARKTGGEMVLRIEDTDLERSTNEAVDVIMQGMEWMGLSWNRGPFFQTKRFDRYGEVIQQLLDQGDAYHCFCSRERLDEVREQQRAAGQKPRYDHRCRDLGKKPESGESSVVRFRNPLQGAVLFDDVVRGSVAIDNQELDDLIIARTDGSPTYNLTVVVDDMDMGITHVIRGDDHTNNTPRQINIFKALGAELPVFAHVPLILGPDGQRLSKRHGAVSVLEYRDMGILPEALLNYLVRLGWSHGDQEIFELDEMIDLFDIADINKSAASFDMDKLLWVNQHYIKQADGERLGNELAKRLHQRGIGLCDGPKVSDVIELFRDRCTTLEDMADQVLYLYQEIENFDDSAVTKHLNLDSLNLLDSFSNNLTHLDEWTAPQINECIKKTVADAGVKFPHLALPLRVAISGSAATPSIDQVVMMVGKERTISRIQNARILIEKTTK
ncbi:MAG: glutamate--tRNA ligase [Acidiferrobacterales bacterium]|nr:glutamate--tRNA ligase [Acidiferrobacterales bacterium]